MLVRFGDPEHLLQEFQIVVPKRGVLDPLQIAGDECFLSRLIVDGDSLFPLVRGNAADGVHPLFKERCHLRVDFINDEPRLFHLIHCKCLPAVYKNGSAPSEAEPLPI